MQRPIDSAASARRPAQGRVRLLFSGHCPDGEALIGVGGVVLSEHLAHDSKA